MMKTTLGRWFAATAFAVSITSSAQTHSVDVVIVGAGTGGVAAALQAARLGAHVALLEETDWIGGQMSAAAVSTMDEGEQLHGPQGIYDEFRGRMEAHYKKLGKSVGTCYYHDTSHCYEPSVEQAVLHDMIDEVNQGESGHLLSVYLRRKIISVLTSGPHTVTGVVTQHGEKFEGKVVIDATEFGDVLPLTPASYRFGNNVSGRPPHPACMQDITYVAVIKRYPKGVPHDLLMKSPPPGYDKAFQERARLLMQKDGNPSSMTLPVSFTGFSIYRGIPDSSNPHSYSASQGAEITKTELNWFNDYPVTTDILDPAKRKDIVCKAKLRTLDFLYFIQHDLGESLWSIANDEGFDSPYNREDNECRQIPAEFKAIEHNFPPAPYVRESRRLVGESTITALDIRRDGVPARATKQFPSAIALGDYGNDLHGCDTDKDIEQDLEHIGDRSGDRGLATGPFQIPEEVLIPQDIDGLLVAEKNLSQSRLASGATRLQPVTMVVGQAAGALAALAAESHIQPRAVNVMTLQDVLLHADTSLSLFTPLDQSSGSELWRSGEFAMLHGWFASQAENAFGYGEILSRAAMAETLAAAFSITPEFHSWRANVYQHPSFKDVPLYSEPAGAIESLYRRGVLSGCGEGLFCPSNRATEADLVQALRKLRGDRPMPLALEAFLEKRDTSTPLSKAIAAEILYRDSISTVLQEAAGK